MNSNVDSVVMMKIESIHLVGSVQDCNNSIAIMH